MAKYPIRILRGLRPLFLLIGATPSRAFVEVDEDGLLLRFGWWSDRIELDEVASVEPTRWRLAYGLGMRIAPKRTLGLVGSTQGAVAIELRGPRVFRVPFKMRFARLVVSFEEPELFVEMVRGRLSLMASRES